MMKGLWIKDFYGIKKQSAAIVITFLLSVFCLLFFEETGILIGMGIFAITSSFVMLNSLTNDQQNNGLQYLLTLPFSKKQYVIEKYLLLILTIALSVLLVSGVAWAFSVISNWELSFLNILSRTYLVGLSVLLVLIVTTQVQIKEGPEKAQLAMSMMGAIVAVIIGGLFFLVKHSEFGENLQKKILEFYSSYGMSPFTILFSGILLLLTLFSISKSINALKLNEF